MYDINFYDEATNQGESIWPFIGFCVFLAGVIVTLKGVVNLVSVWRDFKIFYDASEVEKKPDLEMKKKELWKAGITTIIGLLMVIIPHFV